MPRKASNNGNSAATIGFEAKLWLAADKLRNNMDAAEYKHVAVLTRWENRIFTEGGIVLALQVRHS